MSGHLRSISYIRTSPTEYHPNIQANALKQVGCTEQPEAESLADPRSALKEILNLLGDGDTLIVYRLDRLGCDEQSVLNLQQQFEAMGVALATIDEHETTGGEHAK